MTLTWEQVVSTALLGTERRTLPAPAIDESDDFATAERVLREAHRSPTAELLSFAATMGTVRRAGVLPFIGAPIVLESTDESTEVPIVATSAAQILDLLLTGTVAVARQNDTLIGMWLDGCVRTRQRIPNRLIAQLLDRAAQNTALRASAAAVIGSRGRYVASTNPSWKWVRAELAAATGNDDDHEISAERLSAADPLARVAMFASWRVRDPDAAREAVLVGWQSESAADRQEFLNALRAGLGKADEQMLERCLDDRSKGVREIAQQLLVCLPGSAHVQRGIERLTPLVASKRFPRFSIDVELPDETIDDAAKRDGLKTESKQPRADLLRQIVAGVPVGWWSQHCDRPLVDVVSALRRCDTASEVLDGLCRSAAHAGSIAGLGGLGPDDRTGLRRIWAEELDAFDAQQRKGNFDSDAMNRAATLATALLSEREDLVGTCFQQDWTARTIGIALSPLTDAPVARATADKTLRWAKRNPAQFAELVYSLDFVLLCVSPDVAVELAQLLPSDSTMQQRLRHLQAAGSIIDAISKEFP